jgi:hypothetical protein
MQTFLPIAEFTETARVLDMRRLGKQRVEALQILNTLTGRSSGWRQHPAIRMWSGFEDVLAEYAVAVCREWIARGYQDTVLDKVLSIVPGAGSSRLDLPPWLDGPLMVSHRSNLIRKFPEHYGPLWPDVRPDLPYVWPSAVSGD